jgi:hypothetical protein
VAARGAAAADPLELASRLLAGGALAGGAPAARTRPPRGGRSGPGPGQVPLPELAELPGGLGRLAELAELAGPAGPDWTGGLDEGEPPDLAAALADRAGHLAPGERRLLAHAIETADPVLIGYTNRDGNHTTRVIDSVGLDGAHVIAWCQLRDDERVFSLHRIDTVAPAPAA